MKKIYSILIYSSLITLLACNTKSEKEVLGYAPIYAQLDDLTVKNLEVLPGMENGGKIYLKDNYFYQIENGKGIHIFDVSDKQNPIAIAFVQVPGAQEISIKYNNLYVNSFNDLVLIDITNILAVKEKARLNEAFHIVDTKFPPESGYFECVDEKKGTVIGWHKQQLNDPKCRR